MPIYRVTFQFSGGGQGWSETHLYNTSTTDFNAIRPVIGQVAQARANLLGDPYYIYAARVSQYLDNAGIRAKRQVRLWKGDPANGWGGWYNLNFGKANWASEPSNVAIQAIGFAANNAPAGFQGNQNQTFLGGPPDDVVDNNGSVFPAKLGWGAAFQIWAGILAKPNSGWGWGGATQLADLDCTMITQLDNGTVQFTPTVAIPDTVISGRYYPARFRGVNAGRSPLNGPVIVQRIVGGLFVTKEVIGIPTAQVNGFCKVYQSYPTFIPYGAIELALRSIKHKRGKSPEAQPGRARKRIRG